MNPAFGECGVMIVLNSTVVTSSNLTAPKMSRKESDRLCDGAEGKVASNRKNGDRNHLL